MEITKIQISFADKNGFTSFFCDKTCHIKTLPYLSIVQAVEGSYDIKIGNEEPHSTQSGGFFVAPSYALQTITHNTDKISKRMICRWVFLKVKINDVYDLDGIYDFPVIVPPTHKAEMNALFDRLFAADTIFDEYICYYEIVKLLCAMSQEKEHKKALHIENALKYIKHHYQHPVTVQDIAEEVKLSESHLFSIFKKEMGVSPIAYLNNYRLSVAADILLKSDKTITEIASMVGIDDSVYFNKLFRKTYQMSPSKYRQTYKTGRE